MSRFRGEYYATDEADARGERALTRERTAETRRARSRLTVQGAVQGVGFRPFVYALAQELGLDGFVRNTAKGVEIEAEGPQAAVLLFGRRLRREHPPMALLREVDEQRCAPLGERGFAIRASASTGERTVLVLPDLATCEACRREVCDPSNRRYRYPFTNCTRCGPRFSIVEALPYDRCNTTMRAFTMCARCQAEYDDPGDRRFHAQPNACPDCGPQVQLWDGSGRTLQRGDRALRAATEALERGAIIALKGLGGYQLLARADDDGVIGRLRRRKRRPDKPLAVMVPEMAVARAICAVDQPVGRLLGGPQAPIVLLRRRPGAKGRHRVSDAVAPRSPFLGVMLPYTPLHQVLLGDLDRVVVATSGNVVDEPICVDEQEALERLGAIADLLLVHDRPIVRHVDDSVVAIVDGQPSIIRRARGYAPLPISLAPDEGRETTLATGAQLKNSVALAVGVDLFVSQHIGDLSTAAARCAAERVIDDLQQLYRAPASRVACDLHPDYEATRCAERTGLPVVSVQHHLAHVLAGRVDNRLHGPLLGVSWDGAGLGSDRTVWGGEFLLQREDGWVRWAHLRPFALPGGDAAAREPRRSALGLLHGILGAAVVDRRDLAPIGSFAEDELALLVRAIDRGVNAPSTSSVGRLFDAIAALVDLRQRVSFEGQAAMALELIADGGPSERGYPLPLQGERPPLVVDWEPMVRRVLDDLAVGCDIGSIARRFHAALVGAVVEVAQRVGVGQVLLTGGCFQNRRLAEGAIEALRARGFEPYWHRQVPCNDGGIAVGQVLAARHPELTRQL